MRTSDRAYRYFYYFCGCCFRIRRPDARERDKDLEEFNEEEEDVFAIDVADEESWNARRASLAPDSTETLADQMSQLVNKGKKEFLKGLEKIKKQLTHTTAGHQEYLGGLHELSVILLAHLMHEPHPADLPIFLDRCLAQQPAAIEFIIPQLCQWMLFRPALKVPAVAAVTAISAAKTDAVSAGQSNGGGDKAGSEGDAEEDLLERFLIDAASRSPQFGIRVFWYLNAAFQDIRQDTLWWYVPHPQYQRLSHILLRLEAAVVTGHIPSPSHPSPRHTALPAPQPTHNPTLPPTVLRPSSPSSSPSLGLLPRPESPTVSTARTSLESAAVSTPREPPTPLPAPVPLPTHAPSLPNTHLVRVSDASRLMPLSQPSFTPSSSFPGVSRVTSPTPSTPRRAESPHVGDEGSSSIPSFLMNDSWLCLPPHLLNPGEQSVEAVAQSRRFLDFHAERSFMAKLTAISSLLRNVALPDRQRRLQEELAELDETLQNLPHEPLLTLPLDSGPTNRHRLLRILPHHAYVMSTKQRVPFMLYVETADYSEEVQPSPTPSPLPRPEEPSDHDLAHSPVPTAGGSCPTTPMVQHKARPRGYSQYDVPAPRRAAGAADDSRIWDVRIPTPPHGLLPTDQHPQPVRPRAGSLVPLHVPGRSVSCPTSPLVGATTTPSGTTSALSPAITPMTGLGASRHATAASPSAAGALARKSSTVAAIPPSLFFIDAADAHPSAPTAPRLAAVQEEAAQSEAGRVRPSVMEKMRVDAVAVSQRLDALFSRSESREHLITEFGAGDRRFASPAPSPPTRDLVLQPAATSTATPLAPSHPQRPLLPIRPTATAASQAPAGAHGPAGAPALAAPVQPALADKADAAEDGLPAPEEKEDEIEEDAEGGGAAVEGAAQGVRKGRLDRRESSDWEDFMSDDDAWPSPVKKPQPNDALYGTSSGELPLNIPGFGESWADREARIRAESPYAHLHNWRMMSVIVKSADDLRQEQFALQLIAQFDAIFKHENLPLWLKPYRILATANDAGLIETIPDSISLDALRRKNPTVPSLAQFFRIKFGNGDKKSKGYRRARRNFVESMAAYSIVTYLLQVKDRHNGNIMLDAEGHVIHIDFGFMLSNAPGGIRFERAPFKLTRDFVEVMGGEKSASFHRFRRLCVRGFLAARKHRDKICLLCEAMFPGTNLPCFKDGQATLDLLHARFCPSMTKRDAADHILSLIDQSLSNWRTWWYDKYQRLVIGIM